jgi:hypothetical protein
MIELNRTNIDEEIRIYLDLINRIKFPERRGTNIDYMLSLKRGKIHNGPYPNVSIFEASNRIFSDIVILFGVREILLNPQIGSVRVPFSHYNVRLGNEDGFDIEAVQGDERLVGEAFNVAKSFFSTKHWKTKDKLAKMEGAEYRLIMFNHDAVSNPESYKQISQRSLLYLPVNWQKEIEEIIRIL